MFRSLILAGASAAALSLGSVGMALAAGNAMQGQNANSQAMEHSQASGSHETATPRNEVMQAQRKLESQGLYKGQVDGVEGPETQQAVKQFQEKNKLQQTGQLDQETLSKLGINEQTQGSGSSQPPPSTSGNSMQSPTQKQSK